MGEGKIKKEDLLIFGEGALGLRGDGVWILESGTRGKRGTRCEDERPLAARLRSLITRRLLLISLGLRRYPVSLWMKSKECKCPRSKNLKPLGDFGA